MASRALINVLMLISIFFLPWWSSVALMLVGIFLFKNFYEAIFAGVLLDVLYGTSVSEFAGAWFVFSISALGVYFLVEHIIKKNIRFYDTQY